MMTETHEKAPPPELTGNGAETRDKRISGHRQANGSKTNWQGETDIFAEAREAFTVTDLWQILRLPGEPRPSCHSPFREDKSPSFSIFDGGKGWKDHATGDGGSVVDFVMHALACDLAEARNWLAERLGIDRHDHRRDKPPEGIEGEIRWPGELVTGTSETWQAFARKFGIAAETVEDAVERDNLRFLRIRGIPCYVITDSERRAAEIRRCDGQRFFNGSKAYPLANVRKSWPIGGAELRGAPMTQPVFFVEGASDYLAALDLHHRWTGEPWVILSILGASVRKLAPEIMVFLRNRRICIAPDGDAAGWKMAEHFRDLLAGRGCTVETLPLPAGEDIRSLHQTGALTPDNLFQ